MSSSEPTGGGEPTGGDERSGGDDATLRSAQAGDEGAFARLVAPHRGELRALCYRMAGSLHDADDLLQESLLRAWRGLGSFAGRSSLRTWLYRVTTNACLDVLESRAARSLPTELGPPVADPTAPMAPMQDPHFIEPCPDELWQDASSPPSPEARYSGRQSVALAFVVAVQLLPPRQRAVLLLRDVIGWQASECAELLDLSVAAVNSALQRARETLAAHARPARGADAGDDDSVAARAASTLARADAATAELLARYVQAWERADVHALVALLHHDATLAMPPFAEWLSGAAAIGAAVDAMVFGPAGAGYFRCLPTRANGQPAFAVYERDRDGGGFAARSLHVLEPRGDRLATITAFLDPRLPPAFGLPARLD